MTYEARRNYDPLDMHVPCDIDNPRVEAFIQAIRRGNWAITACRFAGLDREKMQEWFVKGRARRDSDEGRFVRAYDEALGEFEDECLQAWRHFAKDRPRMLVLMLDRRFKSRWSRTADEASILKDEIDDIGRQVGPREPASREELREKLKMLATQLDDDERDERNPARH